MKNKVSPDKLRKLAEAYPGEEVGAVLEEAADYIQRLEAALARAKKAKLGERG